MYIYLYQNLLEHTGHEWVNLVFEEFSFHFTHYHSDKFQEKAKYCKLGIIQ